MRISKSILIASVFAFLLINSVYTQDTAAKKGKAPKAEKQEASKVEKQEAPKAQTASTTTTTATTATNTNTATATPKTGAAPQKPLKFLVFSEECFDKFTHGILDIDCIKFTISKTLSLGIIAGSLLYKAPQIIKILMARSVEGLALSSFYFQLTSVMFTIGYNLHLHAPISTYAENISICIQTAIIIVLFWKFNPKTSALCVIASIATFSAIGAVLYLEILPDVVYSGIGVINIVLFLLAVIPQIKLNFKNKSTGQLAFVTYFLAWAGNVARVFTTTQEVNDPLLLAFFIIGSILNGIVLLQFVIYGGKAPVKEGKEAKEDKKVKADPKKGTKRE